MKLALFSLHNPDLLRMHYYLSIVLATSFIYFCWFALFEVFFVFCYKYKSNLLFSIGEKNIF